ncbi:hypothetical protein EI94DRAFT_27547 [Lactarius quietus]|nr:hypothetical protein EI94DRAFT_27547 [Lactarius quietus]
MGEALKCVTKADSASCCVDRHKSGGSNNSQQNVAKRDNSLQMPYRKLEGITASSQCSFLLCSLLFPVTAAVRSQPSFLRDPPYCPLPFTRTAQRFILSPIELLWHPYAAFWRSSKGTWQLSHYCIASLHFGKHAIPQPALAQIPSRLLEMTHSLTIGGSRHDTVACPSKQPCYAGVLHKEQHDIGFHDTNGNANIHMPSQV